MGRRDVTDSATGTIFPIQNQIVSSVDALAGNGVFTSNPVSNLNARRIVGSAFADQAGVLSFEMSDDGVNWEAFTTTVTVGVSTYATFDQIIYSALVRLVYTNGAAANTIFRLSACTYPY